MNAETSRRAATPAPSFSIHGGPLQQLGARLGLVRGDNTIALGLALGWLPWLILIGLAALQGYLPQIMSLSVANGHVRLLLVVPLLFICETALNAHAKAFLGSLVRSGVVAPSALPALKEEIDRIRRLANSWIPDLTSLLAAAILSYLATRFNIVGKTGSMNPAKSVADLPLAAAWYWLFCLPLFRFLLFRWLWRLFLWWRLLWRLSRIDLHLVPTHPDGVAGLGYLEVVESRLAPFAFAISAMAAGSFAEEISTGRAVFEVVYPEMVIAIALGVVLILGPPLIFASRLRECQEKGLRDYMELASRYVGDFERKWIGERNVGAEPLLGSGDIQTLADLNNSFATIRNMRLAPVSLRQLSVVLTAAIAPMLPVFLFKYPLAELCQKVFMKLTGL